MICGGVEPVATKRHKALEYSYRAVPTTLGNRRICSRAVRRQTVGAIYRFESWQLWSTQFQKHKLSRKPPTYTLTSTVCCTSAIKASRGSTSSSSSFSFAAGLNDVRNSAEGGRGAARASFKTSWSSNHDRHRPAFSHLVLISLWYDSWNHMKTHRRGYNSSTMSFDATPPR